MQTSAMNKELCSVLDKLRKNYLYTVRTLANAIEAKDRDTKGHCDRVTQYALAIGRAMELEREEISSLEFASLLHDIGKIGIPIGILNKKGKLSNDEFELIRKHPELGYEILKDIGFLERSSKVLLQHHERIDGQGYPQGISGEKIDKLAKILVVADSFDAMISSRPYRTQPLSVEEAIRELRKNINTQFCPEVVECFTKLLQIDHQQEQLNSA